MIALALAWVLLLAPPSDTGYTSSGLRDFGRRLTAPLDQWIPISAHLTEAACEQDRQDVAHQHAVAHRASDDTDEDQEIDEYLIALELRCVAK